MPSAVGILEWKGLVRALPDTCVRSYLSWESFSTLVRSLCRFLIAFSGPSNYRFLFVGEGKWGRNASKLKRGNGVQRRWASGLERRQLQRWAVGLVIATLCTTANRINAGHLFGVP
ncbi:hypothetical protein TcWFU_003808 [Taenia crassiceps]|uniref:Uncharacterized protein n=1 Tax=Taenia crassiceps TaxID=6207 RepID=A0ABR4Q6F8_9CEST